MPELPEVETVKNVINPLIKDKKISDVLIYNQNTIITDINSFSKALKNETFLSVERKGKFLLFNLTNNKIMLSHLRMEGKYFYFEKDYTRNKHDMVSFVFSDGSVLAYNDVRKFGILGIYNKENLYTESPLNKLGKEPFDLTKEELLSSLKNAKCTIKEALLDQSRIAGLGNIYVDETLFACHIHPKTLANSININQCDEILVNSRRILTEAIKEGGSTIKSFHPTKGVDGRMQNRLLVYGHDNEPCPICGTKLRKTIVGGRGTTFCPNCQISSTSAKVVAVTGPIHSGKSTVSKYIEEKGYYRIDCDQIVHDLYQSNEVLDHLHKLFKDEIFTNNNLDKAKLSSLISKDKDAKKQLISYIHPLVAKSAKAIIKKSKASKIVFEVPLLVGSGLEELVDEIILVLADEDIRKDRLENEGRDSSTLLKINASYRLKETEKIATYTIINNGDIKSLKNKIDNIIS